MHVHFDIACLLLRNIHVQNCMGEYIKSIEALFLMNRFLKLLKYPSIKIGSINLSCLAGVAQWIEHGL